MVKLTQESVGKTYINRCGEKIEICGRFVFEGIPHFLAIATSRRNQYGYMYFEDGTWTNADDDRNSKNDIVREDREPEKLEYYIAYNGKNFNDKGAMTKRDLHYFEPFETFSAADIYAQKSDRRVYRVNIEEVLDA